MESLGTTDIFATKGIEYLFVIGYLALFVAFWRLLTSGERKEAIAAARVRRFAAGVVGMTIPRKFFFHQGHGWTVSEEDNAFRVGMDWFAANLVGEPTSIELPQVGSRVTQNSRAWRIGLDRKHLDILSPVDGEVVEVNQEVMENPGLLTRDPYQDGWLFKVRPSNWRANLKNLLSGKLAEVWQRQTMNRFRDIITVGSETPALGATLLDGGLPAAGVARHLPDEVWEVVVEELF